MASAAESLIIEIDARAPGLQKTVDETRAHLKLLSNDASAASTATAKGADTAAASYGRVAQRVAAATEQITRSGSLSAESVSNLAVTLGGPLVAAAGVASVALIHLFTQAREEAKRTREEIAEEFGKIASLKSAADAGAAQTRLYRGDVGAAAAFDKRVELGDTDVLNDAKAVAAARGLAGVRDRLNELIDTEKRLRKEVGSGEFKELEAQYQQVTHAIKVFTAEEKNLTVLHAAAQARTVALGKAEAERAVTTARLTNAKKELTEAEREAAQAAEDAVRRAEAADKAQAALDLKAEVAEINRLVEAWAKVNQELDELLAKVGSGDLTALDNSAIRDAINRAPRYEHKSPVELGLVSQADIDAANEARAFQETIDEAVNVVVASLADGGASLDSAFNALADGIGSAVARLSSNLAAKIGGAAGALVATAANAVFSIIASQHAKIEQQVGALLSYVDSLKNNPDAAGARSIEEAEEMIKTANAAREAAAGVIAFRESLQPFIDKFHQQVDELLDIEGRINRARANGDEGKLRQIERDEELAKAGSEVARNRLQELYAIEDANRALREAAEARRKELEGLDEHDALYDIDDPLAKLKERLGVFGSQFGDLFNSLSDGLDLTTKEGLDEFQRRIQAQYEKLKNMSPEELEKLGIDKDMFDDIIQALLGLEDTADDVAAGIEDAAVRRQQAEESLFNITDPAEILKRRVAALQEKFGDIFGGLLDGIDLSTAEGVEAFQERLREIFSSLTPDALAALGIDQDMFDQIIAALLNLKGIADDVGAGIGTGDTGTPTSTDNPFQNEIDRMFDAQNEKLRERTDTVVGSKITMVGESQIVAQLRAGVAVDKESLDIEREILAVLKQARSYGPLQPPISGAVVRAESATVNQTFAFHNTFNVSAGATGDITAIPRRIADELFREFTRRLRENELREQKRLGII